MPTPMVMLEGREIAKPMRVPREETVMLCPQYFKQLTLSLHEGPLANSILERYTIREVAMLFLRRTSHLFFACVDHAKELIG